MAVENKIKHHNIIDMTNSHVEWRASFTVGNTIDMVGQATDQQVQESKTVDTITYIQTATAPICY